MDYLCLRRSRNPCRLLQAVASVPPGGGAARAEIREWRSVQWMGTGSGGTPAGVDQEWMDPHRWEPGARQPRPCGRPQPSGPMRSLRPTRALSTIDVFCIVRLYTCFRPIEMEAYCSAAPLPAS